ncbi:MAG: T9SS type A sorting domain-containing protein [Bacteroidota bacterium]
MKSSLAQLLFCLFTLTSLSIQAQSHEWSYNLGSATNDEGRKVATDADGNVYITGVFTGTVDFDLGAGTNFVTSEGGQDGYVVKLNAVGNFEYVYTFGGPDNDLPIDIAVDVDGTVYLVGVFRATCDFWPSYIFGANRTSAGLEDLFLLKLDPAGVFQWVMEAGGIENDGAHDVAIDSNGDVYITGGFEGFFIDFNPIGNSSFKTSLGSEDAFIAKYNANGFLQWFRSFGHDSYDDLGTGLAVDSLDGVYACGHFEGDMDFLPADPGGNVGNPSGRDGYLLKYDNQGALQWYRHFDGALEVVPRAVNTSPENQVYVTGYFQGVLVNFDGYNLSSAGSSDIFLAKYSSNGAREWTQRFGGTRTDFGEDVVVALCGNVYICGSVEGMVDFDPGAGVASVTAPISAGLLQQYGYFTASFTESGATRWAGGGGNLSGRSRANGIALDDCDNIILTGSMNAPTPLNLNNILPNTPNGSGDAFVSKHNIHNAVVIHTYASGLGSFHKAIECANRQAGPDSILFDIPGPPNMIHTLIDPLTLAVVYDDSTIIYAPSQPDYFPGKIVLEDQIYLSNPDHCEINGMHITNNAGSAGIFAFAAEHLLIKDNIIGDCSNGLQFTDTRHLRVEGNIIGLEADGITPDGNSGSGISLNSDSTQIGGLLGSQGNVISSNAYGLSIRGSHNVVQGNVLGTDASEILSLPNTVSGIDIFPNADSNLVGGSMAGAANVIAYSFFGIVANNNVGNTYSQNSIYCNSAAGINLVSPNISFPVIVSPDLNGIYGTADPGNVIELFEHNATSCAAAPCQGKHFLGSAITDAAGVWFVPGPFPIGMSITATATDTQGNTSAFSLCNVVDAILATHNNLDEELNEQSSTQQLSLSPNPTQDICQISWTFEGSVRLRLLNLKGQTILQEQVGEDQQSKALDLSHLANGVYAVEVISSFGERQSQRLVKRY